jgi:hypothetical protein
VKVTGKLRIPEWFIVADVLHWTYGGVRYASPIVATCPHCKRRAVIELPAAILSSQPDATTHVCHPLLLGCNHGFKLEKEDSQ